MQRQAGYPRRLIKLAPIDTNVVNFLWKRTSGQCNAHDTGKKRRDDIFHD
jgi:hypothetical protein